MLRNLYIILTVSVILLTKLTETESHTKSECGVAETAFGMCVPYVMGEEPHVLPNCCAAVKSVRELVTTRMGRRGMCECLKRLMVHVGKIDRRRAAVLPRKCRVRTNVIPTSIHFPCYKLA